MNKILEPNNERHPVPDQISEGRLRDNSLGILRWLVTLTKPYEHTKPSRIPLPRGSKVGPSILESLSTKIGNNLILGYADPQGRGSNCQAAAAQQQLSERKDSLEQAWAMPGSSLYPKLGVWMLRVWILHAMI